MLPLLEQTLTPLQRSNLAYEIWENTKHGDVDHQDWLLYKLMDILADDDTNEKGPE